MTKYQRDSNGEPEFFEEYDSMSDYPLLIKNPNYQAVDLLHGLNENRLEDNVVTSKKDFDTYLVGTGYRASEIKLLKISNKGKLNYRFVKFLELLLVLVVCMAIILVAVATTLFSFWLERKLFHTSLGLRAYLFIHKTNLINYINMVL